MITIAETVLVPHPPEVVWEVVSDPNAVVTCIEGSELGAQHEDGTFDAKLAVKFAALKVAFAARVGLELDEAEHIGHMRAQGADSRGSTRVQANATFTVLPAPQGSEVVGSEVVIDGTIEINGQLAGLVTTGAAVVVARMTRQFAVQLAAACAAKDPQAAAAEAATTQTAPQTAPQTTAQTAAAAAAAPSTAPTSAGDQRWWHRLTNWWKTRRTARGPQRQEKKARA